MVRNFRKGSIALVMDGLIALSLSGCSSAETLPFFEQTQGQADTIPSIVTSDDIDRASSRYLGQSKNGVDYFAAQTLTENSSAKMTCLVTVAPDEQWTKGCSETLPVTASISSLEQEAILNPAPQPDSSQCTGERECVGKYVQLGPLSP
ncbi:hypothetical protein [Arthrobacter psychrochitiniphilus]|uniref:hypothetical protein n=1 Tax=Arthrobacter psychrochitiniphilus TaxID=291045 RepID=UPI003F7BC8A2